MVFDYVVILSARSNEGKTYVSEDVRVLCIGVLGRPFRGLAYDFCQCVTRISRFSGSCFYLSVNRCLNEKSLIVRSDLSKGTMKLCRLVRFGCQSRLSSVIRLV
jgi:hypothetical protein